MSRWKQIVRAMMVTGLTFSAGVGLVATVLAGIALLLPGPADVRELARLVTALAAWAFPVGVAFSGVTAVLFRNVRFEELSVPRFAALGAGAGLLLYGGLAAMAWDVWTVEAAVANALIFVGLGAGSATASLLIARRGDTELPPGESRRELDAGAPAPDGLTGSLD